MTFSGNLQFERDDILSASSNGISISPSGLIANSDDAWFVLKPDQPLSKGWYEAKLFLNAERTERPKLYFDLGFGFNEMNSAALTPTAEGAYIAKLKLPSEAVLLRLDPTDRKSRFDTNGLQIRPLSTLRLLISLCAYAAAELTVDGKGLLRRFRIARQILSQPRVFVIPDAKFRRGASTYQQWIASRDFDSDRDSGNLRATLDMLPRRPLISVVMPVYNTPETLLRAAIDSVFGQVYDNWQLCIADDCSVAPHVRKVLNNYAARDKRVKVIFRQENGHISRATNTAFSLAEGDWIALLDHDDLLRPHSLAEVAMEINRHPEAEIIYSDEDKLDQRNNRYDPYFKPDFSRELFRSQNYLNHLTVHRAQNISAVGGWRTGFEGSQDYDLSLRIFERIDAKNIRHIPKVLYHWRAVEGSTASSGAEKTYAYEAGFRALQEHVARTKLAANVEDVPNTPFYRLRFSIPKNRPLVSLIIPTRDEVQLLQGCIRSILEKTTYPKYEILIINNRSTRNDTYTYFSELKKLPNVRVIPYDKPFNYSAMNNFAVSEAQGPIVGLINNDIAVISPDWLTEMVSWAAQDDIGCVGAKLYYANDTIQHAGVILGIGGVANHAHLGLRRGSPGYFGRAIVPGNFSAVTAACMIVRKFVYDQVGGLDAVNLPVAFNDVDFSLRVHQAGYQNVWTPYAELYHFESMSRGKDDTEEKRARFLREVNYMMHRWRDELALDPNYSPNFTNMRGDFSIGT